MEGGTKVVRKQKCMVCMKFQSNLSTKGTLVIGEYGVLIPFAPIIYSYVTMLVASN